MTPDPYIFVPLLIASLVLFAWSCYRRLSLVACGAEDDRLSDPVGRIRAALQFAFGQKKVLSRPFGANHAVIFWAFLALAVANGDFLIHGVFPGISLSLLPPSMYGALAFVFDLASLLALLAVGSAVVRRIVAPPFAGARTGEAFVILGMIALLMLVFFGMHGAEIALGTEAASGYMPVSRYLAGMFSAFTPAALHTITAFSWWIHAVVLLAFMNYLPYSKHMHILTAIPNCFFRNLQQPNTQPREEFSEGKRFGVGAVDGFTWKDLLDSVSCTECGRCQTVCPAALTGKSLNPRQVVHDIKTNLFLNAKSLKKGERPLLPLIGDAAEGASSEETVWSCTTCGACMEACPVLIEQMPKIVKMRRHLVEMEARFPVELINLFENIEGRSNPWGIAPSERSKWSSTLEVKPFEAGKTEYLFYVGCAGAFDSRQKQVTVALATILDAAGVSWGILGRDEMCCGDSLRRLGNEFAFDRVARENVQMLTERGVTKILTHCPHCFSTLKNDYRQYGLELEVVHHSELINQLMKDGKLALNREVTGLGTVLYHDSCYLGRHNDVYQAPREVIATVTGQSAAEFSRNLNSSFCCGAGGGRMWLEEQSGTRINRERAREALGAHPDTICVSCPYCMTMFGDALKDEGATEVKVKDIAEVVAEGLR
ncbi:MAG: heterodisulfide reductase-related iron-sulfur binding cluster [Desulfuromonadaceae bacterium]